MAKNDKEVAIVTEEQKDVQIFSYGEDSGNGFENIEGSDLSIPFLNILQSNSPEVEDQLIDGAESGMFLNSVTKEISKEIIFLPVHREEAWVEWVPRIKGGGYVGIHDPAGELVQGLIKANGNSRIPPKGADGKRISFKKDMNDLIETYYIYGLILNAQGTEAESFAVLSFSSTKIKPYRDWLTSMFLLAGKPPMFANRARLRTEKQKNESGSYHNFNISPLNKSWRESLIDPVNEADLLKKAKDFKKMVLNGVARADFGNQQPSTPASGNDSGASDEKAPF